MDLNTHVKNLLLSNHAPTTENGEDVPPSQANLNNSLRLLAKWRTVLLQNTLLKNNGAKIISGPFIDLLLGEGSTEGCFAPKILGTYEQPLHNILIDFSKKKYKSIVNIGCAEGYYVIGFCKLFPRNQVLAFDIDEMAVAECSRISSINNMKDRVRLGKEFKTDSFRDFSGENVFYFVDIEGAEVSLFSTESIRFLKNADLIIECHSEGQFGTSKKLDELFKATHDVSVIRDDGSRQLQNLPSWFLSLEHLDQLLCTWEWRSEPTPWVVAKAKR